MSFLYLMIAALALDQAVPQAKGVAQKGSEPERSPDPAIIVEGRREAPRVERGEWSLTLSRMYSVHGGADEPDNSVEKHWRFCLRDVEVEMLVRLLVGQGRSDVVSTPTFCKPIRLKINDGHVRGNQRCSGGRMAIPSSDNRGSDFVSMWSYLSIWGDYSTTKIDLEFSRSSEPAVLDASTRQFRQQYRWSINGKRLGECPAPQNRGASR